ncbi:MAG: alpha-amylase family glycosyl hydrolase [Deinococcales bacterium]
MPRVAIRVSIRPPALLAPVILVLAVLLLLAPGAARADAIPASLGFHHDPTDPVDLSRAGGHLWVRIRVAEGALNAASVQPLAGDAAVGEAIAMARQGAAGGQEAWIAEAPAGLLRYRIELTPSAGGHAAAGPYAVPAGVPAAVPWVAGSVGYQIFPDRFANGDPSNDALALATDEATVNPRFTGPPPVVLPSWSAPPPADLCCHAYYGGDLQGILDELPYLVREGVTVLYLNPIVTAGSAHGYDASSFLQVAPHLGDLATLRRLLRRAHALGMRVLFDFVPDHTGLGFWAFQSVVRYGPDSPYWNWYVVRRWPFQPGDASAYASWSGVASLPQLNLADPGVERYLLEVARYWLTVGFDGLRVDAPNALVDGHGFVRALRRAVEGVRPGTYLVGEIWSADTSWLQGDQFDSLMNYALGRDVLLKYAKGASPLFGGRWALAQLSRLAMKVPTSVAAMGFNLIDSHDTSRLLTDLGGGDWGATPAPVALERQRLASALLFAMPGMPVTFQGDECAQLGQKDGDLERYPVQWDACDAGMQAHYALLAHLKATLPALDSPLWLAYRGQGAVLAFFRGAQGRGRVLAAFNAGAADARLALPAGSWSDAVTRTAYRGEVTLPARGWRYLVRNGADQ